MTNEADPLVVTRDGAAEPVELRGSGGNARVRPWPFEPTVAHLVLLHQQQRLPTLADLARWGDHLTALGYTAVRTSALATPAGLRVESAGYTTAQELALLAHEEPGSRPDSAAHTTRLAERAHHLASDIDCAAFAPGWRLDTASIGDVCRATPRHRARLVDAGTEGGPLGYAITGRDARQGFLQRLAVRPEAQGRGLGRALVDDSLQWLARWRVQRVLVNTATDNVAALALYERTGFHRLGERLRVYERSLG